MFKNCHCYYITRKLFLNIYICCAFFLDLRPYKPRIENWLFRTTVPKMVHFFGNYVNCKTNYRLMVDPYQRSLENLNIGVKISGRTQFTMGDLVEHAETHIPTTRPRPRSSFFLNN